MAIDNSPDISIPELKKWNADPNPWKARASLVAFAQCTTIGRHKDIIERFSTRLIKREERFGKTAVGWVLRVYSKIDSGFVETFIDEHEEVIPWPATHP